MNDYSRRFPVNLLLKEINLDYKWKRKFFELKTKYSRNLNENSRRFTFNLAWKKYFCVQKKEEIFTGKKTKFPKYERLFTKNHAHARPIEVYTAVESFKTTFQSRPQAFICGSAGVILITCN